VTSRGLKLILGGHKLISGDASETSRDAERKSRRSFSDLQVLGSNPPFSEFGTEVVVFFTFLYNYSKWTGEDTGKKFDDWLTLVEGNHPR
jgi:hypothetical protein